MKYVVFSLAALLASFSVNAAAPCSIHPKSGAAHSGLAALAKVTQADAQAAALKAVNVPSATVQSAELEAEGGCLIYTFDIQVPGKTSVTEVAVDAGTGKILSQKREGPKAQAAEAAADAAAPKH